VATLGGIGSEDPLWVLLANGREDREGGVRGHHEISKWTGWITKDLIIGGHLGMTERNELVVSYGFVEGA